MRSLQLISVILTWSTKQFGATRCGENTDALQRAAEFKRNGSDRSDHLITNNGGQSPKILLLLYQAVLSESSLHCPVGVERCDGPDKECAKLLACDRHKAPLHFVTCIRDGPLSKLPLTSSGESG